MDARACEVPALRLRVLFAASEVYPLAKTGGLADAAAALPAALAGLGADIRIILPGYPSALDIAEDKRAVMRLPGGGTLLLGRAPDTGIPVYLVDEPELFRRDGGPYQDADKRDWPDNLRRFAAFCRVGAHLALHGDGQGWQPDLVHANDWHTGLLPAFLALHGPSRPRTVFTIHNLAFQGNFPLDRASTLGLPAELLTPGGAEFYGQLSCLKAGIRYADKLTTVSPTYAREILTPEFGAGMEGLLQNRADDLVGILNGIDCDLWNPSADANLPAAYDADNLEGKRAAKALLCRELGLAGTLDAPLVVGVNRLTHQKMADVVLKVLPALIEQGVQVALHGEGDSETEAALRAVASGRGSHLAVRIGYEERLAHRLLAAGDLALNPARFEPCGLTTMYAMRYGALPVTRPVGGLADSVTDVDDAAPNKEGGKGFMFVDPTPAALSACVDRAAGIYRREPAAWQQLQRHAMHRDFGWQRSARRYLELYRALVPDRPGIDLPRRSEPPAPILAGKVPADWSEAAD